MILTTENLFEIFSVIGNVTIAISTIIKARSYTKKFEIYCTKDDVDVLIDRRVETVNKILEVQFKNIETQLIGLKDNIDEFKGLVLSNKLKITD